MGMYNLIEERTNEFWETAQRTMGNCSDFSEFANTMQKHLQLLAGSSDSDCWEEALYEQWQEKQG